MKYNPNVLPVQCTGKVRVPPGREGKWGGMRGMEEIPYSTRDSLDIRNGFQVSLLKDELELYSWHKKLKYPNLI